MNYRALRQKYNRTGTGETIIAVLLLVAAAVALMAVQAWIIMLLLGILHHVTGWPTAIGYGVTFIAVLIFSVIRSMVTV